MEKLLFPKKMVYDSLLVKLVAYVCVYNIVYDRIAEKILLLWKLDSKPILYKTTILFIKQQISLYYAANYEMLEI